MRVITGRFIKIQLTSAFFLVILVSANRLIKERKTDFMNIIWLIVMAPISAFFTGLGVYAWKREKPMWFWSGTTVDEKDITDIRAYNRANGIMWLVFSFLLWADTLLGAFNVDIGGIFMALSFFVGIPALALTYKRIYAKYKR